MSILDLFILTLFSRWADLSKEGFWATSYGSGYSLPHALEWKCGGLRRFSHRQECEEIISGV